jgi:hypothetical protein
MVLREGKRALFDNRGEGRSIGAICDPYGGVVGSGTRPGLWLISHARVVMDADDPCVIGVTVVFLPELMCAVTRPPARIRKRFVIGIRVLGDGADKLGFPAHFLR